MTSGAFLLLARQRLPSREQLKSLAVVAGGMVVGFPLLPAWAMRHVDASHGGVVLGILPLATAATVAMSSGERPSRRFWVCAVIGSALVALAHAVARRAGLGQRDAGRRGDQCRHRQDGARGA